VLDRLAFASFIALVAIWAGYPALIAAAASLRSLRRRPASATPPASVSVIIASREPAETIAARVHDVLDTDLALPLEVIVAVDRAKFEQTRAALATLAPAARVVAGDAEGGKAASLNAGVRAASGDVLIFTDTHQRFDRSTMPVLTSAIADARAGAVSGALALPPGTPPLVHAYWSFERWLRAMEARVHSAVGVTGAVYAMRRSAWTPLPAGLLLDDVWVPMRLILDGARIGFEPGARARETRTPEPEHEYRRKVRTLTGVFQLCAWLPAVLLPWRNPIWVQFVFHKLLRLLTPYLILVIGAWAVATLARGPGAWALLAGAAVAIPALWLWRTRSRLGRRLRTVLAEAVLLQLAMLKAGWNGVRRRWHVWDG